MADSVQDKLGMSLDDLVRDGKGGGAGKRGHSSNMGVGRRCYISNLAFKTTWQELKDFCRQAGTVVHAKILEDEVSGSSKGCGVVEFASPEDAANAIETLHDKELHGRLLSVREDREDPDMKGGGGGKGGGKRGPPREREDLGEAKRMRTSGNFGSEVETRRCYVGNLSYKTSWQDLKDHFKQAGRVVYTGIMEDKPGWSKGCGIVEFETAGEAAKAIEMLHDSELNGRPIFVREDREDRETKQTSWKGGGKGGAPMAALPPVGGRGGGRGGKGGGGGGDGESRRVYVGNLSYRTSWQDLKDHFRAAGTVVYSCIIEETGTRRSKGCGIVEYSTSREAERAIDELHDTTLNGRVIFVREDREDREAR